MGPVRHRDHNSLMRAHRGDHILIEIGECFFGRLGKRWKRLEILSGKRLVKFLILLQYSQARVGQGTDVDLAHHARALQMINGRQEQVVGDHTAADDGYIGT